jgi:hypothetical protein
VSYRLIVIVLSSLAALLAGCQFGGYVPKGTHQPVAEEERNIADLSFLTPASGTLDCANGRCRVRHRLQVTRPGHVDIVVEGPRGTAESNRPRLARAMLQDVNGRVVARNDVEQTEGAMTFDAEVTPGPYFVLIQGLGGEFVYEVTATYAPDAASAHAGIHAPPGGTAAASGSESTAAAATGAAAEEGRALEPSKRAVRSATAHAPGDTSDGADFAYDPTADLLQMRTYAFAENPQSQLDGQQSEGRGNPFVIRRIQREIRYALADMGVQQVEADAADFLVSVQVGSRATTWYSLGSTPRTTSYDAYFDRWRGMGAFINPHTYVDGTLVIDFIDPKSGDLVWHGWTTEPVNVKIDDETMLAGAVRAVLSQIVEK